LALPPGCGEPERSVSYRIALHAFRIRRCRDMKQLIRKVLTGIGSATAHPVAFLIVIGYAGLWFLFAPAEMNWHSVATLATWLMTLFIQRSEHRDTQAIHGKLDELLKAKDGARTELAKLDEKEPEEIEEHRRQAKLAG
jgi:low affinity Fe/Cu permease